jgi:hypothetical protein
VIPAQNAYRAAPIERPRIALREVTAPLGFGRGLALAMLVAGSVAAMVPQAETLDCIHSGDDTECNAIVFRGLFDSYRHLDTSGLADVVPSSDPDLPLREALARYERQSDGRRLALPSRGVYYDPADVWRNDARLVATARGFLLEHREWNYFAIRQSHQGVSEHLASAVSFAAPLLGLALLLLAERKTRVVTLTIDPNARAAHARSVGLGGPALDRACSFGPDARLQRVDDAGSLHLPLVRVTSDDGGTPPIFTGHAFEHREALDRVTRRANRALSEGTAADPSPSLALRFGATALLALASVGLAARVASHRAEFPATTGTVALTNSIERCESEGVTLLRGGAMEWVTSAGLTTRTFSVPGGPPVPVTFEVRPDQRTAFDCALLRGAPPRGLRVRVEDVRPE